MVHIEEIHTLDGVKDLIFEQVRNPSTGRYRSSFFYRGLPDKDFSLTTSLQRNCGDMYSVLETPLLENFIKYVSIEDPTIADSI